MVVIRQYHTPGAVPPYLESNMWSEEKLSLFPTEMLTHRFTSFNPLNAELNPICHLLALLEAHHILHISRVRVNVYGPDCICIVQ
jgi:hypothetical protein